MNCPECNAEMVKGVAQVRGTIIGFLVFGFSSQDLYFDRDNSSSMVLYSRQKKNAFQCPKCQGVYIPRLSTQPRFETDPDTGVVTEYTEDENR
jgi:predicted RNA-binding Zn-ribbon protein involved in translation (DUF1610 family)